MILTKTGDILNLWNVKKHAERNEWNQVNSVIYGKIHRTGKNLALITSVNKVEFTTMFNYDHSATDDV